MYVEIFFAFAIFLISSNLSFSQFVLGKNISSATSEIKTILLKSNFHFLNQKKAGEKPGVGDVIALRFKEEFKISFYLNEYENVTYISISTEKEANYKKLKDIFRSDQWKYIKYSQDQSAQEYSYKEYIVYDSGYSSWIDEPNQYVFAIGTN